MTYKFLMLFGIIFLLTFVASIAQSRRALWRSQTRNSRAFTIRGILLLFVLIVFLVFSLFR